jgi:hypothetical protein
VRELLRRGAASLLVLTLLVAGPDALAAPAADPASCRPVVDELVSGEEAIEELGDDLEVVARRHALAADDLSELFEEEPDLHVDVCGHLLYLDTFGYDGPWEPGSGPGEDHDEHEDDGEHDLAEHDHDHDSDAHQAGHAHTVDEELGPAALSLLAATSGDDVFALHSRPGALRTIYLDVDGHVFSGTWWNDSAPFRFPQGHRVPGFDRDGLSDSFDDGERAMLREVWARVAEDFAPFDVNVTTQEPHPDLLTRSGSSDLRFGVRVVISSDSGLRTTCSCAGIAWLGTFDRTTNHLAAQVAFALPSAHTPATYLASTVSHEVGHTLNLHHHGSSNGAAYYGGHGPWAPIMGGGAVRALDTWSHGEYASASLPTQDDLAIMATRGLPVLADDHGNTLATATPLSVSEPVAGLLTTSGDVDVFRIVWPGGPLRVEARAAPVGPNLDLAVQVLAATGTVLATLDAPLGWSSGAGRPSGVDVLSTVDVPAGDVYLRVDGVGWGDPLTSGYSDYASLGHYTLVAGPPALAITTSTLAPGAVGVPYTTTLATNGAQGTPVFSVSGGALPPGVTLRQDGLVSGTPVATGSGTVAVAATDGSGRTASRTLSWQVQDVPEPVSSLSGQGLTGTRVQLTWPLPPASPLRPRDAVVVRIAGADVATTSASATGIAIDGLQPGVPVTFEVAVTGQRGRSETRSVTVAPLSVPPRPAAVRARQLDSKIEVSWEPVASTPSAPFTRYVVVRERPSGSRTTLYRGTATTWTDTFAVIGETFTYHVSSEGPGGVSAPRSVSAMMQTRPIAPWSVTATTGSAVGAGAIRLRWPAWSEHDVAPPTGYHVLLDGSRVRTLTSPDTTSTLFTGLADGRTYTLEVRPYNAVGEVPGPITTATPVRRPAAPTSLSATRGDRSLALSWPAVTSTAAAPVTGYRVLVDGTQVHQGTGRSHTLTGLTAGRAYDVSVVAYGRGGVSTARSTRVTAVTKPAAPTSVSVARRDRSLALSWPAVTSTTAAPVTGYRVLLDGRQVHQGTGRTHTITGLTAGASRTVSVVAYGPGGVSSRRSSTVTVITVPNAQGTVKVSPTSTSATVSWTGVTSTTARPVTGYDVLVDGRRVTSVSSGTRSATVTGLPRATRVTIAVRPTNSAGRGRATSVTTTTLR